MKTFYQFMEQVPHMNSTTIDLKRAQLNALASRQSRRHVHQELARTAEQERKDKNDAYNA